MKTKKFMKALIADVILDIENGAADYEADLIHETIGSVLYMLGKNLDNNRLPEVLAVCNKAFNE